LAPGDIGLQPGGAGEPTVGGVSPAAVAPPRLGRGALGFPRGSPSRRLRGARYSYIVDLIARRLVMCAALARSSDCHTARPVAFSTSGYGPGGGGAGRGGRGLPVPHSITVAISERTAVLQWSTSDWRPLPNRSRSAFPPSRHNLLISPDWRQWGEWFAAEHHRRRH